MMKKNIREITENGVAVYHQTVRDLSQQYNKSIPSKASFDGKENKPGRFDQDLFAETVIKSFASCLDRETAQLQKQIGIARRKIEHHHQKLMLTPYLQGVHRALASSLISIQRREKRVAAKQSQVHEIKEEFDNQAKKCERKHTDGIPLLVKFSWLLALLTMLLAFCDNPLYTDMFEFMDFGWTEIYLVTFVVGVSVAFIGHKLGVSLKRYRQGLSHRLWTWGLFMVVSIAIVTVGRFRYEKVHTEIHQTTSPPSATEPIVLGAPDAVAPTPPSTVTTTTMVNRSEVTLLALSIMMNLLVFLALVILSYMGHDSSRSFQSSYRDMKLIVPRLNTQIRQLEDEIDLYRQESIQEVKNHYHLLDEGTLLKYEQYEAALVTHSNYVTEYNRAADEATDLAMVAITSYRNYNLAKRTDPASVPEAWDEPPTIGFKRYELYQNNILQFFKIN